GASRVLAVPNQAPGVLRAAGFTRDDADRAALAVDRDGRRYRGAAAVNRALRALDPPWRQIAALYVLPGVRQVEDLGYRLIARSRSRLSPLVHTVPACEESGARCE